MAYTSDKWLKRMSSRTDLTMFLTHLTRPVDGTTSTNVLIKILKERKINGSTTESGFIVGTNKAVCFQEAPLSSLAENVLHEETVRKSIAESGKKLKTRYEAAGLSFVKPYLYKKGARPVIYEQTEVAKRFLNTDEYWRIVNFDLNDGKNIVDWTHEREWRIKGDFEFELNRVTVILPNRKAYKEFIQNAGEEILTSIEGIVCVRSVIY